MKTLDGHEASARLDDPYAVWCPSCHADNAFDPGPDLIGKRGQIRENVLVKCYYCGRLIVPVYFRDTYDDG